MQKKVKTNKYNQKYIILIFKKVIFDQKNLKWIKRKFMVQKFWKVIETQNKYFSENETVQILLLIGR